MLEDLPLLLDADEAIEHLKEHNCNDAVKAYAIGIMSKDGLSNKQIRRELGIQKVYTATHYIRAGTKLSEDELRFWNENIQKVEARTAKVHPITLGHVRVLAKYNRQIREDFLSQIEKDLVDGKPISIPSLVTLLAKKNPSAKSDIKVLEEDIGVYLGREVFINYSKSKGTGSLRIKYYSPEDLEVLLDKLKIKREKFYE